MENYNYNSSTVIKYLRKVLNEINRGYIDSGMRSGFIMKRYVEKYKIDEEIGPKLVLLCLLKDIGLFYTDGSVPKDNPALAAASSYTFLKYCSPLDDAARPLLFYKAKYLEDIDSVDYYFGLLMTLINQVVMYDYQEYSPDEIIDLIKKDDRGLFHPDQVKKIIKLLKDDEDILEKLNDKSSLFIYETSNYILKSNFTNDELLGFIDTTNFAFEFHNHETLGHTITTAVIARELAKKSRLPEGMVEEISLAALLHDIGKIRVPKEVLCFPGRLEGEALKEMRRHVTYTKEILENSFSYKIVEIASNHHEKLDGSGYPRGLRAVDLSVGDKIVAVADLASALYCKRSYKKSFSPEQIISILEGDAKDGKIEMRIVKHLIDNFDEIMSLATKVEAKVIESYEKMQSKCKELSNSPSLKNFFNLEDKSTDIINE